MFYTLRSTVDIRPQVSRLQMCTVIPSLPEGIVVDTACAITGIPMRETPKTLYTVTAMTENGTISTEIHIEIRDPLCVNPRNGRSMVIGESMEYHCTQDNKIGVETYMCVFGKNDGEWKLVSDGCKKQREWGSVLRYGIMISYVISVVVGVVFAIVMVIRKKRTPQPPAMENKNLLV